MPTNSSGEKIFAITIDGNAHAERVLAAEVFALTIQRAAHVILRNLTVTGSGGSMPIAVYRGFNVTVPQLQWELFVSGSAVQSGPMRSNTALSGCSTRFRLRHMAPDYFNAWTTFWRRSMPS
jgi:hypothetical protein